MDMTLSSSILECKTVYALKEGSFRPKTRRTPLRYTHVYKLELASYSILEYCKAGLLVSLDSGITCDLSYRTVAER